MDTEKIYFKYSDYLKNIYGQKVYKLPVNLPVSCPNRIGGADGCTFCSEKGTGFESCSSETSVARQLNVNKAHIAKKYHVDKFIAYFQNYTNTFMPLEVFCQYINEATQCEGVVAVCISTRPDCVRDTYLDALRQFKEDSGLDVIIELGLQSVNYKTLDKINRGHGLAEFIDCVLHIQRYGFTVGTHLILNLPWDTPRDVEETSKVLSVLPVHLVKLHSLYLAKGTEMARQYGRSEFQICSPEEYFLRLQIFLDYLRPDIAVERLFSRIPEEDSVFSNWGMSWWRLMDMFEKHMLNTGSFQGRLFHSYVNGAGLLKGDF